MSKITYTFAANCPIAVLRGRTFTGARCGLTPYDAAARAAQWMIEYAQSNPDGGDLMAPPEVLDLVPAHLRSIDASA